MFLKRMLDNLEKSFWFIPALFTLFPFIIFYSVFEYAIPNSNIYTKYTLFFHIVENPETANVILGAIAAAVVSIISISFSITVVVLSIASQQYSPRLLQNFMRQNDTKVILGIFISTFIYCLITIGLTQKNSQYEAVFTLLAFIGFLLGIFSLLAFIYFINYVIQTISLTNIISNIEADIIATYKKFYPETADHSKLFLMNAHNSPCEYSLFADVTGYLQSIDYDDLVKIAINNDCTIKILYSIGDYVLAGSVLLEINSNKSKLSDEILKSLSNKFIIHNERKIGEDILFPITEMVDIAVRALSPGINDPRTAINCIDVLAKTLVFLSKRAPMPECITQDNKLCVIRPVYAYKDLIRVSFRNIYDNAKNNRLVLTHLISVISLLIKIPSTNDFKNGLLTEANMICSNNELSNFEKQELEALYSELRLNYLGESNASI